MKQNAFPKREKLKSSVLIAEVFTARNVIYAHPLKLHFLKYPKSDSDIKLCVSVSKKLFKSAVDRNRVKRQLREVYRLNKSLLERSQTDSYALVLCYTSKEKSVYKVIESTFKELAGRFNKKMT